MKSALPFLLFAAFAAPCGAENQAMLKAELIFEKAPFAQCHASTIVETGAGLVTAWFGGTAEGNPDVGIWLSREESGGWTSPVEVADGLQSNGVRIPCWNPVLFKSQNGPLFLFYKVGPSPSKWWGMEMRSADDGKTWSEARRLPEPLLGPIKNKPVQLPGGEILSPSSVEDHGWQVHFEKSTDGGATWKYLGPVNDAREIAAIQPSILLHGNGRLQAIGRTKQRHLFTITSTDNGDTWGPMTLLPLPNPNSGIDAVTMKNGQHALIYNHTANGRTPLNLAVSGDGKSWNAALVIESEPGEYSYPAIIQTSDRLLHVTYTWKRQRIKHVVIDPAKLELQPIVNGVWPE
ncbi:MAG TPA: sialidase family protein [Chthoniobacteraceae bacterium]